MPGLGDTKPFHDTNLFELCHKLSDNIDVITLEYEALIQDMIEKRKDRFQSITSMNYDSGWKTVVLFYNGHRIPNFPYHLCPITTQILESVPLAGRIAGFNRQMPNSGIPLHSDGNNMVSSGEILSNRMMDESNNAPVAHMSAGGKNTRRRQSINTSGTRNKILEKGRVSGL
jgi:hypothetical protein